jgi:hypothetical protein
MSRSTQSIPYQGIGPAPMVVTTTFTIEGYRIRQYLGIVRGIIVRAPTITQGFLGGLKSIVGGNIGSYTEMCEQARQQSYTCSSNTPTTWAPTPSSASATTPRKSARGRDASAPAVFRARVGTRRLRAGGDAVGG